MNGTHDCCYLATCCQVPGLFAASLARFKAMPAPEGQSQLYWINWWLRCVPLPEQMHVSVSDKQLQLSNKTLGPRLLSL